MGTRPNMVPIVITTGTGPQGAQTTYPQPPSPIESGATDTQDDDITAISNQSPSGTTSRTPTPASETAAVQKTPQGDSNAKGTKGKGALQPPKPSPMATAAIKKAARRKSGKQGIENTLMTIQRYAFDATCLPSESDAARIVFLTSSVCARMNIKATHQRMKEQTNIRRKELLLGEFKMGLITKSEYRKRARKLDDDQDDSSDDSRPAKKRKAANSSSSVHIDDSDEEDELDSDEESDVGGDPEDNLQIFG
jgi:hypothetical protein